MDRVTHENLFTVDTRPGRSLMKMEEYERDCCYHVYQEIWEAAVGEVLACERQPRNATDIRSLSKEGRNDYRALTEEGVACLLALPKERGDDSLYCDWKKVATLIYLPLNLW